MKILIVGGGVSGLSLAGLLRKYGLGSVTLIEKASDFRNAGFLIGLWGNGRRVLRELGIEQRVIEQEGYEISWNAFHDRRGKLLKSFPLDFKDFGPPAIIARSTLQKGLVETISGVEVRFGTTIERIQQINSGRVQVDFGDRQTGCFDIVVGADGVRSLTRELVFGENLLKYYGWGVWAFWLPDEFKHPDGPIELAGNGKMYAIYPLYNRSVVMFVARMAPGEVGQKYDRLESLQLLFSEFNESARQIIAVAPDARDVFFDDLGYVDCPTWVRGSVVLMGDAKHATSPISGVGASLAMEDAFVLADELRRHPDQDLQLTLLSYAKRREKRIQKFQIAGKRIDKWAMAAGFPAVLRDILLPLVPTSFFLSKIRTLLSQES